MEKRKLDLLKKILNTLEVTDISCIKDTKSVLLNFTDGIRVYIDANAKGVEFSLEAMTDKGAEIIETLKTDISNKKHK